MLPTRPAAWPWCVCPQTDVVRQAKRDGTYDEEGIIKPCCSSITLDKREVWHTGVQRTLCQGSSGLPVELCCSSCCIASPQTAADRWETLCS